MGNIIVQPDGELALIDIADMRINWFALNNWQRKRNFQHVFRYASDQNILNLGTFIEGYCDNQSRPEFNPAQLSKLIDYIQPKF